MNVDAVYLAAQFPRRVELKAYADELTKMGFVVICRWLNETDTASSGNITKLSESYLLYNGIKDIEDIQHVDTVVLFTEDPTIGIPRGGRHFESGYAYALRKKLVTVGPKENIFHHLPDVTNVETWEEAKVFLIEERYQARLQGGCPTVQDPCGQGYRGGGLADYR